MDEAVEKVLLVCLGWLLGILGPVVTEAVKRQRERNRVQVTLLLELDELAYKLALSSLLRSGRAMKLDRAQLQWMLEVIQRYKGSTSTESIRQAIESLLTQPDTSIACNTSLGYGFSTHQHLLLSRCMVPLLDSRLSTIWHFSSRIQAQLIVLRAHIDLLNQLVEQHNYYVGLMFSVDERDKRKASALSDALAECGDHYGEQARVISEAIHELSSLV